MPSTRDRLEALREADAIVREEIDKAGLTIRQYFAVVPDFRTTRLRRTLARSGKRSVNAYRRSFRPWLTSSMINVK